MCLGVTPIEAVMPNLSQEWTGNQQVLHSLGTLVTKQAESMMREAVPSQASNSPTIVLDR